MSANQTKQSLIAAASLSLSRIKSCECGFEYIYEPDECPKCGRALTRAGVLNQADRREAERPQREREWCERHCLNRHLHFHQADCPSLRLFDQVSIHTAQSRQAEDARKWSEV